MDKGKLTAQQISGYISAAMLDLEAGNYDGELDELYMLQELESQLKTMREVLGRLLAYHYHNDLGVKPKEYHDAIAILASTKP